MTNVQFIVFIFLAMPDTKNITQPIAIVHPLRTDHDQQSSYVRTALTNDTQDQDQNLSDVEVTVISSESPPPVTYIGNPSEELGQTSEVSEDPSTEVACTDCQPTVESDHEFVMVPGEVIRRRGSILKNPNAPVSDYSFLFIVHEVLFNQTSC